MKLIGSRSSVPAGEPSTFLVREMELTLDHLSRVRATKTNLTEHLDAVESPIDNRLLNLTRLPFEYSTSLWVDRDRIRGHLMQTKVRIETQRQKIIRDYEREVRNFHDRLLLLLNKHEQLDFD